MRGLRGAEVRGDVGREKDEVGAGTVALQVFAARAALPFRQVLLGAKLVRLFFLVAFFRVCFLIVVKKQRTSGRSAHPSMDGIRKARRQDRLNPVAG